MLVVYSGFALMPEGRVATQGWAAKWLGLGGFLLGRRPSRYTLLYRLCGRASAPFLCCAASRWCASFFDGFALE